MSWAMRTLVAIALALLVGVIVGRFVIPGLLLLVLWKWRR